MNVVSTLIWGFVATVALTSIMEGSQALGLSRMSLPYMLGTVFTGDRRRAPVVGAVAHFVFGFAFAFLYTQCFELLGSATWWIGALMGVAHAIFVFTLLPLVAGVHPRMATAQAGPSASRKLQPPGFLALHYGNRTPLVGLIAHLVYGLILGAFYQV